MTTTPLWVPLVVAGLGVLGTIAGTIMGVLMTQNRSDRREGVAWKRERERQRYERFHETLQERARSAYEHEIGSMPGLGPDQEIPFEWHPALLVRLEQLGLYGSAEMASAAKAAYDACAAWWFNAIQGEPEEGLLEDLHNQYDLAAGKLQEAIRRDLAIGQSD